MTEAQAISENEEGFYGDDVSFFEDRADSIAWDYENYRHNKAAKIGTDICCAENRCSKRFTKKSYQQAFCCTKHKDQFWNRQRINQ